MFLLVLSVAQSVHAQSVWYFGTGGGPAGSGASVANKAVTFTDGGTASLVGLTATYSLSNQQFAGIEGNPAVTGTVFGAGSDITVNAPPASLNYYPLINSLSSSTNSNYTACRTCASGTGINVATNSSIELALFSDALIKSDGTSDYPLNSLVQFADLTINFNQPVSYPVIHFTGLGGDLFYNVGNGANYRAYSIGFSLQADLLTPGVTLTRLSGSTFFGLDPTNTKVMNTATAMGFSTPGSVIEGVTRYAASGSVLVNATNLTSVSFRLYLKGDGGTITNNLGNPASATNGNAIQWSDQANHIPAGGSTPQNSVNSDAVLIGVSLLKPVNVSGNVFNDPNAGNVNNSSGAPNLVPGDMFVSLLDSTGKVVATTPVGTDGTYSFQNVFEGRYQTILSTTNYPAGTDLSSTNGSPSSGWQNTGDFNGPPDTGNSGTDGKSSPFTVAATDVTNINFGIRNSALPVTLVSFSGKWLNNQAALSWTTSWEENVSHFEVQHRTDAGFYETEGTVAARNNLHGSSYAFVSHTPEGATTYYRLKTVDRDGTSEYSKVISFQREAALGIAPNPFYGKTVLTGVPIGGDIQIRSLTGLLLLRRTATETTTVLDLSRMESGMYILSVADQGSGRQTTYRLVKQ